MSDFNQYDSDGYDSRDSENKDVVDTTAEEVSSEKIYTPEDYNIGGTYQQESGYGQSDDQTQYESSYGQPDDQTQYESSYGQPDDQTQYESSYGQPDDHNLYGTDYGQYRSYDGNDGAEGRTSWKKRRGSGDGDRKKNPFPKLIAGALVFGLVAGAAFAGVSYVTDRLTPSKSDRIETTSGTTAEKSETGESSGTVTQDVTAVVDDVMPSVVSITCQMQTQSFFGTTQSEGAGSGFIISKTDDLLMIATNNHVVEDATSISVGFNDSSSATGTVVGTDTSADLAVVSVKISDLSDDTINNIKVATLGDSSTLKAGESVIAIGNALGYGQSVTTGVISATNREVSFTDGTMTLIQTDAAINPGNSGGVLVNTSGQVIGINNAKLEDTSVEGMGYAIPISDAKGTLEDLMNAGSITDDEKASLGIRGRDIDSQYSEALGIPTGIYITEILEGSAAEKAGLNAQDIIVKFDGASVTTMSGLQSKISSKKAGTKVTITVKRADTSGEYQEKEIEVTLGKQSDLEKSSSSAATENQSDNTNGSQTNPYGSSGNGYSNGSGGNYGGSSGSSGGSSSSNPFSYFYGDDESDGSNPYYYGN